MATTESDPRAATLARERAVRAELDGAFVEPAGRTRRRAQLSSVPYLPGLDGMRALAVVAVMVYHASSDWLPGGFLGVEVFFVISGYLITLLLIAEHERDGRVDLKQFWIRRARRLLPALFVMMSLLIVYTALFRSSALGQLRGDVVAGTTYVSNWYQIWVGQGYSASGDFAPLRHLWSLAVEEQFYIVWPLAMVAMLRVGSRGLFRTAKWLVLAALGVTVLMAVLYTPGRIGECAVTPDAYWTIGERCISKADTLYLSTITRAGGLLLGAAFAMIWRPVAIMRGPMRRKGPMLDLLALVGVVGLAAMTWWIHFIDVDGADPWLFRGGFFASGVLTLFIIAAVTHRRAVSGKLLGNPVLLWIGTRSYGLYLYHWPIYQIIRRVAGNALTVPQFVVAMALTVLVTELSYQYVETPIRKRQVMPWLRRLRAQRDPVPRQLVAAGAAASLTLVAFGVVQMATAPLEQNEIAESLDAAEGDVTSIDALLAGDGTGEVGADTGGEAAEGAGEAPFVEGDTPVETVQTGVPTTVAAGEGEGSVTTDPDTGEAAVPEEQATTSSTAAPTTTTTTVPPQPISYLAIGDSVMLGAAPSLSARGLVVDAAVNRQLIDMIEPMQALRDNGRLGNGVVIHLGTNGPISEQSLNALLDTVSEVPLVVLMNVKADRSWTAGNNALIQSVSRPNVIKVDWQAASAECPGNCFYDDGIHLRPDGQAYYAERIFASLGLPT